MTRFGVLVGTLAALALGRDLAAEQQRQARDGFWFGAALGSGWARVSCQICQGNNRSGLSGTLRLGGGVSRKVLIGAEVAAWWATIETATDTVHQSLVAFGAAAYWYPSNRRPLYLKLGIGLVTHRADDGTDVITSSAIGPQFGVGYEWPVSPHVLVSPRSEEHTSELQSPCNLVCRLLLEKKKNDDPAPDRKATPHHHPTSRREGVKHAERPTASARQPRPT